VRRYLESEEARQREDAIYGIPQGVLGEIGPAVAPVNGVIAALAATEFMAAATGMREPARLIKYRGDLSKVLVNQDPPLSDCPFCKGIRGKREAAEVERYLEIPHLQPKDKHK